MVMGPEVHCIHGSMAATAAHRRLCLWHENSHFELVTSDIPEWIWLRGHREPPSTQYAATHFASMRGGGKLPRRAWQPLDLATTLKTYDAAHSHVDVLGRGGIRRLPPMRSEREQILRQTRTRHSGGEALPTAPPTDPVGRVRHWIQNTRVRRHPNEGLVNCLFLAASQALTEQGYARNHLDLRQEVTRYIQAHADALIHTWDWQIPEAPGTARPCQDSNEYLEALRQPGAWGGSLELAAMASMFPNKAIMVLGPHSHPTVLGDRQRSVTTTGNRIALWYQGGHYEMISSEIPGWIWGLLWEEGAPHADPVDPPPEAPMEPPLDEPHVTTMQLPLPGGEGGVPTSIDEIAFEGIPPSTPDPQLPLAAAPPVSHSGIAPPGEDPQLPPIEKAVGSARANEPIHEEISLCTPEGQPTTAGTSPTHCPVGAAGGRSPLALAPAPQQGPETDQDRRPEHPTALPMAQPHTLGRWPEDLRQTARLLTAQGPTYVVAVSPHRHG